MYPIAHTALFTIARTWKKPRCPLKDEWIKKLWYWYTVKYSVQFSSFAQSYPTLCDCMKRRTPGLPVHHQLLEFTQTHVQIGDAIQPSHLLLSPSPPAPNTSQHQSLFQWVKSSHEVAKELEFRMDLLDLLAVQGTLKSLFQHHSLKASTLVLSFLHRPTLTSIHGHWKNCSLD